MLVRDVQPGGVAAGHGGLHKRDLLLAVDGVAVTGLTHADVVALVREAGEQLTLVVATPERTSPRANAAKLPAATGVPVSGLGGSTPAAAGGPVVPVGDQALLQRLQSPEQPPSQFKALDMWRGLKQSVRSIRTGGRWRWFRRYVDACTGREVVTRTLGYLHGCPDPQYRAATREKAFMAASMLIEQGDLIPAQGARSLEDSKRRIYYISPVEGSPF